MTTKYTKSTDPVELKPLFTQAEIAAMTLQELHDKVRWAGNLINDRKRPISNPRVLVNTLRVRTDIEAELRRRLAALGMV